VLSRVSGRGGEAAPSADDFVRELVSVYDLVCRVLGFCARVLVSVQGGVYGQSRSAELGNEPPGRVARRAGIFWRFWGGGCGRARSQVAGRRFEFEIGLYSGEDPGRSREEHRTGTLSRATKTPYSLGRSAPVRVLR